MKREAKTNYNKNNGGNKQVKKAPISTKKFVKTFSDFFDGIEEIKNISPAIFNLFADFQPDEIASKAVEDMTRDDIMEIIINIAYNKLPLPVERVNTLWEFTIAGNRVMVKTDKFVSFGWQTKKVGQTEMNTFTMIVFGEGQTQTDMLNGLADNGWEEVENKKLQQQK